MSLGKVVLCRGRSLHIVCVDLVIMFSFFIFLLCLYLVLLLLRICLFDLPDLFLVMDIDWLVLCASRDTIVVELVNFLYVTSTAI